MGKKVERVWVGMSQGVPFEDEVIELAPKEISMEARKKAPTAYGTSFPIRNVDDLRRAIQSFGRGDPSKKAIVKAFIIRRARELGHPEMIPDAWKKGS
jgi:hypothetical protein